MDEIEKHRDGVSQRVEAISSDADFLRLSNEWNQAAILKGYAQNFSWLGRPIVQCPPDIYAIQELLWDVKPDLVIETGVAHGGSLMLSASLLVLMDYADAAKNGKHLTPGESNRRVIGVDIDIRSHNRKAIESHPLSGMITLIEGSSTDLKIIDSIKKLALSHTKTLVFLDSNHTHQHVLEELRAYSPLVSKESYCVVWDTGVDDLPAGFVTDRPWGQGNNPKTAVRQFLKEQDRNRRADEASPEFVLDRKIESKIAITASPEGFLRRVK